jgi:hypothetical protein
MSPAGRNQVDYTDIRYDAITVKVDGVTITYDATQPNGIPAAVTGRALTWSAADTVALAADAEAVVGKLIKLENTGGVVWATMQNKGMATFGGGTAAALTLGTGIVGALLVAAKGYVRSAVAAESPKMHGSIVNAADTAAVVVDLG